MAGTKTVSCKWSGIQIFAHLQAAADAILIWIIINSFSHLRNLSYEFFVIQHILTFSGFSVAIMLHLPFTIMYSRVYFYIPVGLYFVDRVVQTACFAYNNMRPGHAILTAMEGGVTKIRIPVKYLRPGAHALLKLHGSYSISSSNHSLKTIVSRIRPSIHMKGPQGVHKPSCDICHLLHDVPTFQDRAGGHSTHRHIPL